MKFKSWICLAFFSQASVFSQIPAYVPQNGLKGFWPFTGNANDLTTNVNHGVVTGALLSADRFGTANAAYSFNGVSDYIQTSYAGILGPAPRAISFWAKTSSHMAMSGVSWGGNQQGERYDGMFSYNTEGITIDFAYGAITYDSPAKIYDNNWHHYVFQFSNPILNQVEIYQDTVYLTQALHTYNGTTSANTQAAFNVAFGRIFLGASSLFFDGQLDDIGIWDRVLTSCEIKQLYTTSLPMLNVTASRPSICHGESVQLSALGGNSLAWSNSMSGASITVSPPATTGYTVSGVNSFGCVALGAITVSVSECTGLHAVEPGMASRIYPNPCEGRFFVEEVSTERELEVSDLSGALIFNGRIPAGAREVIFDNRVPGVYFVKIRSAGEISVRKLIVE